MTYVLYVCQYCSVVYAVLPGSDKEAQLLTTSMCVTCREQTLVRMGQITVS